MQEFDPAHHIKLVVDEWGPWYKDGSGLTPTNQLEQLPTLRDAVFSGLTLDTFNRHPEKVGIGCCAQLINCLNSLYLAHEGKFCVTPVGHTFALYADHQGGQSLRTEFLAPTIHYDRDGNQARFWGLNGSASLHDREIVLTAVNPSVKDAVEAQIAIRGARVSSGTATVLTAPDLHARNTFEQPQAIAPTTAKVQIKDGAPIFSFPQASVVKLNLQLG
jgi:alpha-N-arabinofuranosidase